MLPMKYFLQQKDHRFDQYIVILAYYNVASGVM